MQGLKKTHNWWAAYFGHVGELGGETQQDVQNRMVEFFDETQFEDDKSYVICSHGGPLFFLYQKLNNEPLFIDLGPEEPEGYLDYGQVMKITLNKKDVVEIGPIESPATK
jgi:broad specificity phosphatase PhoE